MVEMRGYDGLVRRGRAWPIIGGYALIGGD
jgi:hypothetical protein